MRAVMVMGWNINGNCMNLKHFFRGFLKKEEVASAFLATLLESDTQFRDFFFETIFPNQAPFLAGSIWNVQVESDRIDVRLESDNAIVLIENKVRSSAYESGQLLRYYEMELARLCPGKVIFVVFVAPQGVGGHEIDNLVQHDIFRQDDFSAAIAWESLIMSIRKFDIPEPLKWFAQSGFDEILNIIENDSKAVYPREGVRKILAQIVDEAFNTLQTRLQTPLSRWSAREYEQIQTNKTNVTMWLDLVFEIEDEPPYCPTNIQFDECLKVTLRTQIKLSTKGKKIPALKKWWREITTPKVIDIPDLGEHHLNSKGWFVSAETITLEPEMIIEKMATSGVAVLSELNRRLDEIGYSLVES